MTNLAPKASMTAEDLFVISSDDTKTELLGGTLVRTPPTGGVHGKVAARIGRLLDEYVEARRLGIVCGAETGFILQRDPDVVRAPDVSFIAQHRIPSAGEPEAYWPFAPDLAVEVVSPSDRADDLQEKIVEYFAAGTRLVWVVHPRTRIIFAYRSPREVRALGEGDQLVADDVLPGFSCPVKRCFD